LPDAASFSQTDITPPIAGWLQLRRLAEFYTPCPGFFFFFGFFCDGALRLATPPCAAAAARSRRPMLLERFSIFFGFSRYSSLLFAADFIFRHAALFRRH
jgi:hypothetical protein